MFNMPNLNTSYWSYVNSKRHDNTRVASPLRGFAK